MVHHVHIAQDGRFLCPKRNTGKESFIPLSVFKMSTIKPAGDTRFCPLCLAAV